METELLRLRKIPPVEEKKFLVPMEDRRLFAHETDGLVGFGISFFGVARPLKEGDCLNFDSG